MKQNAKQTPRQTTVTFYEAPGKEAKFQLAPGLSMAELHPAKFKTVLAKLGKPDAKFFFATGAVRKIPLHRFEYFQKRKWKDIPFNEENARELGRFLPFAACVAGYEAEEGWKFYVTRKAFPRAVSCLDIESKVVSLPGELKSRSSFHKEAVCLAHAKVDSLGKWMAGFDLDFQDVGPGGRIPGIVKIPQNFEEGRYLQG